MRKILILLSVLLLFISTAHAVQVTTEPNATNVVSPCTDNFPILGAGANNPLKCGSAVIISPTATRSGDLIYWNGTIWTNFPGNNSGTGILQENSSGVPSWLASSTVGTVTSVIIAAGGTNISTSGTCTITTSGTCTITFNAGARTQNNAVGNPTGTTSITPVMMGVGSAFSFTPTQTGNVVFYAVFGVANSTASNGCNWTIRYGTGTAPTNGAAQTGSTAGRSIAMNNNASTAAVQFPASDVGYGTGLTLSTAYWMDIALAAAGGGTCTIVNVELLAVEH